MTRFEGERTLMRIFLGESDRCEAGPHEGEPLYKAVVLTLRERGFAGATAVRGVAGFGASARLHTGDVLRLSGDLPVIVEVVEREAKIQEVLPELDDLIDGGLVTLEKVRVTIYRPDDVGDDDRWRERLAGLERENDEPGGEGDG